MLFYWDEIKALADWLNGEVIIFIEGDATVEDALAFAETEYARQHWPRGTDFGKEKIELLMSELRANKPTIIPDKAALFFRGSA